MRVPGPLTSRVFQSLDAATLSSVGGAGGSSMLDQLILQDNALRAVHQRQPQPAKLDFVQRMDALLRPQAPPEVSVDVAVCGGTLGILLACALQLSGHRVAVIEGGPLRGRAQDWNTSMEELRQLVAAGVLTEEELAEVAPRTFSSMRCVFGPSPDFTLDLKGVLDVAVSPEALLRCVRARFEGAGGLVFERTRVGGVNIHPDGARLTLGTDADATSLLLDARLVLDCMGHRSPIALQQRVAAGQAPDGVCVQVGSCAASPHFTQWGSAGDFFCTTDDASAGGPDNRARVQHFWQAFPTAGADDERSTYMFTYLRPDPEMPGLLETMERYLEDLPSYQNVPPPATAASSAAAAAAAATATNGGSSTDGTTGAAEAAATVTTDALDEIAFRRLLFGWFPTYRRNSPLSPAFDRVLSVGDASAVQSPISFGGFCAMLRHLPRLRRGVDLALRSDSLAREDLARLAPYLPNLGTTWMSAAAMTARSYAAPVAQPSPLVNQLLAGNFRVMSELPRQEALTFFRDVTTLSTLSAVLVGQTATMAPLLPSVVAELGAAELAEFSGHLALLSAFTLLHTLSEQQQRLIGGGADEGDGEEMKVGPAGGEVSREDYVSACRRDAWRYGSGLD